MAVQPFTGNVGGLELKVDRITIRNLSHDECHFRLKTG